jgi:hypothetical protein
VKSLLFQIPMSRKPALLAAAALAFAPSAVFAQDKPLSVLFEPIEDQRLNNAITIALTKPPFVLETRYTRSTLVVAIPDRIVKDFQQSGTILTFTATFHRDGDSLGQSVESCREDKLSDCVDQLVSDTKSAAGMGN